MEDMKVLEDVRTGYRWTCGLGVDAHTIYVGAPEAGGLVILERGRARRVCGNARFRYLQSFALCDECLFVITFHGIEVLRRDLSWVRTHDIRSFGYIPCSPLVSQQARLYLRGKADGYWYVLA